VSCRDVYPADKVRLDKLARAPVVPRLGAFTCLAMHFDVLHACHACSLSSLFSLVNCVYVELSVGHAGFWVVPVGRKATCMRRMVATADLIINQSSMSGHIGRRGIRRRVAESGQPGKLCGWCVDCTVSADEIR
jgi:hypothetical protein